MRFTPPPLSDDKGFSPPPLADDKGPAPSGGIGNVLQGAVALKNKGNQAIGGAFKYGHEHPFDAVMNVLGASQRGLQALETGANVRHAVMSPGDESDLRQAVKTKIGLQGLENNQLAGDDLPHKFARGALDFGLDFVNDPMTFAPVGNAARLVGKIASKVPGAARAAEGVGKTVAESPFGQGVSAAFNPDHYLRGLTPEAKAAFEVATNRSMEAVRKRKEIEDALVRKHADAIRKGELPSEVRNLFSRGEDGTVDSTIKKYFPDGLKPDTRPQDVMNLLFRNRAPDFKRQVMQELKAGDTGLFNSHEFLRGADHRPSPFTVPVEQIPEVQKRLESVLDARFEDPNLLLGLARAVTHRGNQLFLANPIPHTGNLASLAYNAYGPTTAVKGIGNAVQVAAGKTGGRLGENIKELEAGGGNSQYGNLFDETGLTRILGIPGTQKAAQAYNALTIPLQKASNYAQHKILNSTETGLRAAALDAEKKAGVTGPQAMKNIHSAFGTDAPNAVTQGAQRLGAPFAKFHLQTVPRSVALTLAKNPARISNQLKAQQDYNGQVNPNGPQYRFGIPGVAGVRSLVDPLYFFDHFGPISDINNPFGVLATAKKGKPIDAAAQAASRFTPGMQFLEAGQKMATGKRGRAGDTGVQDLFSAIVGGYYGKK